MTDPRDEADDYEADWLIDSGQLEPDDGSTLLAEGIPS